MKTDETTKSHVNNCIEFVVSLENSCRQAGGGSWDLFKNMTVEEAMHILAPNGIRFCFKQPKMVKIS